jgi:hypothetical protein
MNGVTSEKVADEQQSSLDLIMTIIFTTAWPVWERYNGDVPSDELRKFDQEGDFPRGVAAAAMTRLSRDKALRKQLRHFCASQAGELETRKSGKGHK